MRVIIQSTTPGETGGILVIESENPQLIRCRERRRVKSKISRQEESYRRNGPGGKEIRELARRSHFRRYEMRSGCFLIKNKHQRITFSTIKFKQNGGRKCGIRKWRRSGMVLAAREKITRCEWQHPVGLVRGLIWLLQIAGKGEKRTARQETGNAL